MWNVCLLLSSDTHTYANSKQPKRNQTIVFGKRERHCDGFHFAFTIYPILILFAMLLLFLFSLLRLVCSVYLEYHSLWSFPFIKRLPNSQGGKYQTKKISSKRKWQKKTSTFVQMHCLPSFSLKIHLYYFTNFCTNFPKPKKEKKTTPATTDNIKLNKLINIEKAMCALIWIL